jgi:DNA repair protein RecO (recombination protein O)
MLEKTEGILFRSLRYGDTSLIVKIFTRKFGYLSFIVPGVRSSKSKQKGNLLQPMNILELDLYWREQKNLMKLKEASPAYIYKELSLDFTKQSIGIFAVELISKCIKEHEQNEALYDHLRDFLTELDASSRHLEYLPLLFLWRVSAILGFEPAADHAEGNYFNVSAGIFESVPAQTEQTLSISESELFKRFLSQAVTGEWMLTGKERKLLLDKWLLYFQWHVPDFSGIQSPKIWHEILK